MSPTSSPQLNVLSVKCSGLIVCFLDPMILFSTSVKRWSRDPGVLIEASVNPSFLITALKCTGSSGNRWKGKRFISIPKTVWGTSAVYGANQCTTSTCTVQTGPKSSQCRCLSLFGKFYHRAAERLGRVCKSAGRHLAFCLTPNGSLFKQEHMACVPARSETGDECALHQKHGAPDSKKQSRCLKIQRTINPSPTWPALPPAGNLFTGLSPHATGGSRFDQASRVVKRWCLCSTHQYMGLTRNTKDGLRVMRVSGPGRVGLAPGTVWSQGVALCWRLMQRDKL